MNTNRLSIAIVATLVLTAAVACAQQPNDEQIALQFVPPAFTEYAASHTYLSDDRTWTVLPVDLDHSGRPDYLAVAYGNGHIGYLRIVRKSEIPSLVGESSASMECDSQPSISAIDLDGDAKPELSFACRVGNHGTRLSWLFRWTNSMLVPLNVASTTRPNGFEPIREANFVDIDGDGVMEILEATATADVDDKGVVSENYDVWHLLNGKLARSAGSSLTYFNVFTRDKGKPQTESETFTAVPGAFTLTMVSGERGQKMVTSGTVTLNGAIIAESKSFSKNVPVITSDVTLLQHNTLSVELHGSPGSMLHILVAPKP